MPTVSVITPAWNAADYLPETLDSVLAQTHADWELLVVDDGSTDETAAVVASYAARDPRVRLLRQQNQGPSAARNHAMRTARGDFFAFLDSDDVWDPRFLQAQLDVFERHPDADLVTGNGYFRGGPFDGRPTGPVTSGWPTLPLAEIIANERSVFIMTVFRRAVFDTIGGFDETQWRSEDYDFWLRAAVAGFSFRRNPQPLGWYRVRGGSLSRERARMIAGILETFGKTRPHCPPGSDARRALDAQVARFESELLLEEAKAALDRGEAAAAVAPLRALHRRGAGRLTAVMAWLAAHLPMAAVLAYRVRGWRPAWRRQADVTARLSDPARRVTATRALVRLVKRADHTIGRASGRVRVLVDVRTPMNLSVLRPVWERLLQDRRLDLRFAEEPGGGVADVLEAAGLREALLRRDAARWQRFDLAITADFWNHTPLRRCAHRINFFHGVAGKYDLDDPRKLPAARLERFDRIAFANEDRLDRYERSGLLTPGQAVLVGFPKSDDLVNGAWEAAAVRASLGLSPSLPTILYAPTFSMANSLHREGEALIAALLATGGNVIVKLHDRSAVPHATYTAGIDWPSRLARFAGSPRFALASTGDAGPLLAAADVLITDHSTVGFEFALLDRPVIVYDCPELKAAARIDAAKWEMLRSLADVVHGASEVGPAAVRALSEPSLHSGARRAAAAALFAYPGQATRRALEVVYGLLKLEPSLLSSEGTHEVFDCHRDLQPRRRSA